MATLYWDMATMRNSLQDVSKSFHQLVYSGISSGQRVWLLGRCKDLIRCVDQLSNNVCKREQSSVAVNQ